MKVVSDENGFGNHCLRIYTSSSLRSFSNLILTGLRLCWRMIAMARGEVPDRIEPAVRLGRIMALQKPDGGVHGIVVSDFFRRAVARTMAQQVSKEVEDATAPFQYAQIRVSVFAHLAGTLGIQSMVDLVSRNAMLRGLMSLPSGGRLLPLCGCSVANLPFSCGKMRLVRFTTSNRVRVANRGTLSCPFCSALLSTRFGGSERKTRTRRNISLRAHLHPPWEVLSPLAVQHSRGLVVR